MFARSDHEQFQGPHFAIQDKEVSIIFKWMLSFSQKLSSFDAPKIDHLHTGYKFLMYLAKNTKGIRGEVAP